MLIVGECIEAEFRKSVARGLPRTRNEVAEEALAVVRMAGSWTY